ncbi:MAG: hypothetical protein AAFZ07_01500 [Actinomycetota bacterium]
MTTNRPRTRRLRLGLAALGATVAGLTMTGGTAGAVSPPDPGSSTAPFQLRTDLSPIADDLVHIDSPTRVPTLDGQVLKTDVCWRSINGTFIKVPARLCP